MEDRRPYKKWITDEEPIYFLNKPSKSSLRSEHHRDSLKPKRLPRIPLEHFRSDFVENFNNSRDD
jgi:hypothetical protein